jgi:hypothetical protein
MLGVKTLQRIVLKIKKKVQGRHGRHGGGDSLRGDGLNLFICPELWLRVFVYLP